MMSIIERLFTKSSSRKTTPVRKRQLRLETLESRELLSMNPLLPPLAPPLAAASPIEQIAPAEPQAAIPSNANAADTAWLNNFLAAHTGLTESIAAWTNGRITSLDLGSKGLTGTLDVSDLTNLKYLYCSGNNLSVLDVSKNTALTNLYCDRNNLQVLDVSKNTALTELDCSSNNLSVLDVSKNTALTNFYCYQNGMKLLYLPKAVNSFIISYTVGNPGIEVFVGSPVTPLTTPTLSTGTVTANSVANASSYTLQRSTSSTFSSYTTLASGSTGRSYTDTSVTVGTTYYYRVKAVGDGNYADSEYSETVSVTTNSTAPIAPTVTKSLDNNGKPKLTWNAVSGAVTYRVYRLNADGKGWTNISGNTFKGTTFTDTSVPAGVHTYAVRAFAADGATGSAFDNTKYVTIGVTPDAPTVTKILDNGKPKLTWNPVTGAVAYRVYRLNDAGNGWINVSGNALKLTTFTDTGVSAGKTYTYSVQAFLNDGVTGSGFVNTKYVTVTTV